MTFAAHRIFAPLFAPAGILILLFVLAFPARAALPDGVQTGGALAGGDLTMQAEDGESDVTWNLTADQVTSLSDEEVLEARGNVILRRGNDYLKADFARYYMTTKWVFLQGNVVARIGKDDLKAREMELDLRTRTGWLKDGEIFMDGPHIYFAGDRIDKHFGDIYSFRNATVTACDGDVPAWSLKAGEAVVEIDGYAQLWHASFQVMDTSVAYLPWMVLPTKRDRQSGFLVPEFGSSDNKGFYINIPYFWAIDESQDLLLNEYFMSKRGLMQGVQYRARPSETDSFWLRLDWMADNERVRDERQDDVNERDGLLRTNFDRYWLRGMFDTALPGDSRWKLRGDIDFVSDQNYLHEFKHNYAGFFSNREEMMSTFGRELRERNQARRSGVQLYRDWDRFSVMLSGTYTRDQRLGHGNQPQSSDTTVQVLPALNAYLHQGRIAESLPLEVRADAEAAYLYREQGSRGARYQMTPQLTLPVNTRFGALTATAGVRQTLYGTETYESPDPGEPKDDGDSQTVPFYTLDASTEVARVFELDSAPLEMGAENIDQTRWVALRHSVQPHISYGLTPRVDQEKNPRYTDEDRMRPSNELTYTLTNVVTRKRERVVATPPAAEGEEPGTALVTDYQDVLFLTLEQSYDFREAARGAAPEYAQRPYSDVMADARFYFGDEGRFSLVNKSFWSPYTNSLTRQENGIGYTFPAYGNIYAGIDYREKLDEYTRYRGRDIKSLALRGALTALDPFSFAFTYRHDYERNRDVEKTLDILYTHQCFQLIGRLVSETGDVSYNVMVVLTGLGD